MRCNCENSKCPVCRNRGCTNQAGVKRAMYIGPICDPCSKFMPREYMLPDHICESGITYYTRNEHGRIKIFRCATCRKVQQIPDNAKAN